MSLISESDAQKWILFVQLLFNSPLLLLCKYPLSFQMSQLLLSVPSRSISPSSTKLSYYSSKTGFKIDAMLEHFESLS